MKLTSMALLAAGLAALSACGGGTAEDSAANNVVAEDLNVATDDLSDPNLLGEEALGNETVDAVDANAAGNAVENSQ